MRKQRIEWFQRLDKPDARHGTPLPLGGNKLPRQRGRSHLAWEGTTKLALNFGSALPVAGNSGRCLTNAAFTTALRPVTLVAP